jgi:hypothetical protein
MSFKLSTGFAWSANERTRLVKDKQKPRYCSASISNRKPPPGHIGRAEFTLDVSLATRERLVTSAVKAH